MWKLNCRIGYLPIPVDYHQTFPFAYCLSTYYIYTYISRVYMYICLYMWYLWLYLHTCSHHGWWVPPSPRLSRCCASLAPRAQHWAQRSRRCWARGARGAGGAGGVQQWIRHWSHLEGFNVQNSMVFMDDFWRGTEAPFQETSIYVL